MIFLKCYLEGNNFHQCAQSTGMDYRHTAVDWASFLRELFCQYVYEKYSMTTFEGDVKLDESIFLEESKVL